MAEQHHDVASEYVRVLHELVSELRADVKELRESKADKTSIRNLRDDINRLESLIKKMAGEPPTLVQMHAEYTGRQTRERMIDGAFLLIVGGFLAWAANGFPVP